MESNKNMNECFILFDTYMYYTYAYKKQRVERKMIRICYYMSCSVSRPVSRPDLAISARVRRTRADIAKSGCDTRA